MLSLLLFSSLALRVVCIAVARDFTGSTSPAGAFNTSLVRNASLKAGDLIIFCTPLLTHDSLSLEAVLLQADRWIFVRRPRRPGAVSKKASSTCFSPNGSSLVRNPSHAPTLILLGLPRHSAKLSTARWNMCYRCRYGVSGHFSACE